MNEELVRAEEFIWPQKYRPQKVDDCILPSEIKDVFKGFIKQGSLPNLLLYGQAGTGKTSVARAALDELDCDYMFINGSKDSGIDTLRNRISDFASSVSLVGGRKFIIIDEADHLNANTTQPALRGVMEEFSANCGFILTCNYVNRIIEPIRNSRCVNIEFILPADEQPKLAMELFKRTQEILKLEGVDYEKNSLIKLIKLYFPDFRRVLSELQRHSVSGKIDDNVLKKTDIKIDGLLTTLREQDFKGMRSWVVANLNNDSTRIFRMIYDGLYDHIKPDQIPQVVLTLADYQHKAAFVADQEINMVAFLTELMAGEVVK